MKSLDQESLTTLSMILLQILEDRFPEWEPFMEAVESESENDKRCLDFRIPAPSDDGRFISVRERGDCIEVGFSDGEPPGGTERLLIGDRGEERLLVEAAIEFVEQIIDEKIFIGREASWLWHSAMPPTFMTAEELPRKKLLKVVSWHGTYDSAIGQ